MTNCSGPPSMGATLIAAVSKMHSSAQSHTCSISIELVCINKYSYFSIFQMLVQACLLKHSVRSSLFIYIYIYIYMNNRRLEINFVNMLYVSFIFFSSQKKKIIIIIGHFFFFPLFTTLLSLFVQHFSVCFGPLSPYYFLSCCYFSSNLF